MNKHIAVLGGGSGAHMMAGDLKLAGCRVNLYEHPFFAEQLTTVMDTKKIIVRGIGRTGIADIDCVTTNIEEALADVELINIVIPSMGHDLFIKEMLPFLKNEQIVVFWAGNFGSLVLAKQIKEQRPDIELTIAEANTLPYGTRIIRPGEVELLLIASKVIMATIPANKSINTVNKIKQLFTALEPVDNVLSVALSNPNPICHPPGSILNTGRIQYSKGDFYMYREGITEAVARVIRSVYDEVKAIGEALSLQVLQYDYRDFMTTGSIMAVAFEAPFDAMGIIGSIKGPKSIEDRYITEDLPYALVPISQLADKLGIQTPTIDALINIGSVICRENYWETGRTLDKLGLADLEIEEIRNIIG